MYCGQIARFLCACLSQRGRLFLGQIRQLQNAEGKTEFSPPSSNHALYSDKARSVNQSERALYVNFIMMCCIVLYIVLYSIVLYCIALHCIALHCIALHCIVLYCIALHCIVLYCIAARASIRCTEMGSFLLFSSRLQNDRKYPRRFEYKIVHIDFLILMRSISH